MVFPAVTVYGHVPQPPEQPTEKQPTSTSTQDTTTYTFDWQIGPVTQPFMVQNAMTIIQSNPNLIFPFLLQSRYGEQGITLNGVYDLNNVRWLHDNYNPVQVVGVTPTSFTFLSLPGNFRGPGATVTFNTYEKDGYLYLQQVGTSELTLMNLISNKGALLSWEVQAQNLRAALYGGTRHDFYIPFIGSLLHAFQWFQYGLVKTVRKGELKFMLAWCAGSPRLTADG